MFMQDPDMIGIGELLCLTQLGHDVTNIDDFSLGPFDGLTDFFNHKIRQDAGIEATWP